MTQFSRRHRGYSRLAVVVLAALAAEMVAPAGMALAQSAAGGVAAPAPAVSPAPGPPAPEPAPPGGTAPALPPTLQPLPGAGSPAAPSSLPPSLAPIAPPVGGTAGQPLPAGVLPSLSRPGAAPGAPPGGTAPAGSATAPAPSGTAPQQAPTPPVPAEAAPASTLSPLEQTFAPGRTSLTVNRQLRQFGYNLFEAPPTTFAPVDNVPVGPDYVVGPGDTLYINMWGLAEATFQVVVDRNGEILLPKVGPVRVWGLKFAQAEALIRDQLTQYYQRVNVSVTMGPLRTMKVFVLGDVAKPGTYTLSSLATITNGLFAAGGPSKQGTLRDVRLIRGNRIVARLDLYKFLLEGRREGDERLLPDDTIFVPPIGPVAALAGYVKRPAIYELKGETTLAQLLEMAGGLTIVSYIKRVQVERVLERQRKVALDTEFTDVKDFEAKTAAFPLQEGDFVSIFPIDRMLYRHVELEGNVRRPGSYALKPGMRVRDLIDEAEGWLPGTYMARADLAKFRDGRLYEMVPLDLTRLAAGDAEANPVLDEFDRLIVYHQWDVQPIPTVQVTGAVYRPGVFELTPAMRVSDLAFRGALSRLASLQNAELYRADPGKTVTVIRLDLARILANPRGAEDLVLTDRDHLYIRQFADGVEKRTVTVTGRVRYPGEYAIASEERLSSLIERAGGFLPDAFPRGAVFTRESVREIERVQLERFVRAQEQSLIAESAAISAGATDLSQDKAQVTAAQATVTAQRRELLRSLASSVVLGRMTIRLDAAERLRGTADDILLENGDSLAVPQIPTSVAVVGAVRSGTAMLYEPNQTVDFYLSQAGGTLREADMDGIYILKPNGAALAGFSRIRTVEAGDAIVVPLSTEPKVRTLPLFRDIATILTGFALPFATIVALLDSRR